jgi:hypothetical protein
MPQNVPRIFSVVALVLRCLVLDAQTIAFPGAEGFGKYTSGGRGGKVLTVRNLADHGPGSFRAAVEAEGPRIVVFSTSGTIALESALIVRNANITIAGQTSPGGVCIKNFPVIVEADNVIIRFMKFRLGDESKQEADALTAIKGNHNIIIDHCSISWATDECASFYRNRNFTLQWCIISESLNNSIHEKGAHGYGGIWGGKGASFHHNLLASHTSRLPRFSGSASTPNSPDELVDFRNNVIYNWQHNSSYGGEKGRYNIVGNYYKPGPATKIERFHFINPWAPFGKFFICENVFAGRVDLTKNNMLGISKAHPDSVTVDIPFDVISITRQNATSAFARVLDYAGDSHCRDSVDRRIIAEVRSGRSEGGAMKNGIIDSQADVGGWPLLKYTAAENDSDSDGMPDGWEVENGLNPHADASSRALHQEYDNIEVYLGELVNGIVNHN